MWFLDRCQGRWCGGAMGDEARAQQCIQTVECAVAVGPTSEATSCSAGRWYGLTHTTQSSLWPSLRSDRKDEAGRATLTSRCADQAATGAQDLPLPTARLEAASFMTKGSRSPASASTKRGKLPLAEPRRDFWRQIRRPPGSANDVTSRFSCRGCVSAKSGDHTEEQSIQRIT